MDLSGKRILVIGLGKTGMATVRFLARQQARMVVTDEKPLSTLHETLQSLEDLPGPVDVGPYDAGILENIDLVIPSPGVPPTNPLLYEALRTGIRIISEIELAYRFMRLPMIAITGTNGKTTTTTLIGEILKRAGKKAFVGGNIGTPLISYIDGPQDDDYAVVEVSSFQLQWIRRFCPFIAILLNITTDHVDYHGTFAAYRQAKERIFENQRNTDIAILNADDPCTSPPLTRLAAEIRLFSTRKAITQGMYLREGRLIHTTASGEKEVYPLEMIKLPGVHNVENVMAAIIAARACGCPPASIIRAVEDFKGSPHRIEFAGEKRGVIFYDDSKGTNVGAVARALETFTQPVILLMGGRDKEGDFQSLSALIQQRVKVLVLFGEARERIESLLGGKVKTMVVQKMSQAVQTAYEQASAGDVVLLSPGCASFDEFADYKARGRAFKEWVEHL